MKTRNNQSSLFAPPAQPRKLDPEPDEFWQAVRALRLAGHKVYRAGRWKHLIDGQRVGESQLLLMAESKQRKDKPVRVGGD